MLNEDRVQQCLTCIFHYLDGSSSERPIEKDSNVTVIFSKSVRYTCLVGKSLVKVSAADLSSLHFMDV